MSGYYLEINSDGFITSYSSSFVENAIFITIDKLPKKDNLLLYRFIDNEFTLDSSLAESIEKQPSENEKLKQIVEEQRQQLAELDETLLTIMTEILPTLD